MTFRQFLEAHGWALDDIRQNQSSLPPFSELLNLDEEPETEPEFLQSIQLEPRAAQADLVPRVATLQMDVAYGDPLRNLQRLYSVCKALSRSRVNLAVFPECFLTGYCTPTREAAESVALNLTNSATGIVLKNVLLKIAETFKIHLIVGYAGLDPDETLYNGACLVTPKGEFHEYRKTHLPELGFDKLAMAGQSLQVIETEIGRIGMLICFDMRFPEAARTLALQGADIIVIPTNWPKGADCSADHICIARAAENRVFVITCNRVGEENGFEFIGLSKIISPTGVCLYSLGSSESAGIADINLLEARTKRTVTIPGKYETDVFARRPELYGRLTQ